MRPLLILPALGLFVSSLMASPVSGGDVKSLGPSNTAVRKGTGGTIGAMPDDAETPSDGSSAPVPIPYPDVGEAGNTTKGTKGVKPAKKLSPAGMKDTLPAGKIVPHSPEISHLSPRGCFVAGDKVAVVGKYFGAEQGGRNLVLSHPVNRFRTVRNPRWGNEKIMFTLPPGVPFNAAGRIAILEGKKLLDEAEILFCNEANGTPEYGGDPRTRGLSRLPPKRVGPGDGKLWSESVSPDWSPPSWMDDGVVEAEKPSGGSGKMIVNKPSAMVPTTHTEPAPAGESAFGAKVRRLEPSTFPLRLDKKAVAQIDEIVDMVFALESEQEIRKKVNELMIHLSASLRQYNSGTEGAGHQADQAGLDAMREQVLKEMRESEKEKNEQMLENQGALGNVRPDPHEQRMALSHYRWSGLRILNLGPFTTLQQSDRLC